MLNRTILFLIFLGSTFCMAQYTIIPDTNFEQALFDKGIDDIAGDGKVPTYAASLVNTLDVSGKIISDLTGISAFTNLTTLNCSNNNLTSLNLVSLTNLQSLGCGNNQITSLNSSLPSNLTNLNCRYNQLSSLNLTSLTSLTSLDCTGNQLTNSNLQVPYSLTILNCGFNQFTSLNVSGLTDLTHLECGKNQISSLNVSGLIHLNYLACDNNHLSNINLNGLTNLVSLFCAANQISSLDVTDLLLLETYHCAYNQLSSINVNGLTNLKALVCSNNQLSSINVTGLNNLQSLNCESNQITSITGLNSNMTQLIYLICDNNQLTNLSYNNISSLQRVDCSSNLLTTIKLVGVTNLRFLFCQNNHLSQLNIWDVPLTLLDCSSNPSLTCISVNNPTNAASNSNWIKDANASYATICGPITTVPDVNFETELIYLGYDNIVDHQVENTNVSGVTQLSLIYKNISNLKGLEAFQSLQFFKSVGNPVAAVNLGQSGYNLSHLNHLEYYFNFTTTLNLSGLSELIYADVRSNGNNFSGLALSGNTALQNLDCSGNYITSLNLSSSINTLQQLNVSNNSLSTLNLLGMSQLQQMNCTGNQNLGCILYDNPTAATNNALWHKDSTAFYTTSCTSFTTIPDTFFEQALINLGYDDTLDHHVLTTNISGITSLILNNKNISNFTGIEAFTSLQTFECKGNYQVQHLNLTASTSLQYLDCSYNNYLYDLNITGLTGLQTLKCSYAHLTGLNLTGFTSLQTVECSGLGSGSQMTSLILNGLVNLTRLTCDNNALTSLNLTGLDALYYLDCGYNNFSSLNVSGHTALYQLNCSGNHLTSIELSGLPNLFLLYCGSNQLSSIDFSGTPNVGLLDCSSNLMNSLDVTGITYLSNLTCNSNQLTSLIIGSNVSYLSCTNNQLTALDFSNKNLQQLNCAINALTLLNLSGNVNLNQLDCSNNTTLTCIIYNDPLTANANASFVKDPTATFATVCNNVPLPIAENQTFDYQATVADLIATGTSLKWYDVAFSGTPFSPTTSLVSGTYFVSQTVGGEESARTSIEVVILPFTQIPDANFEQALIDLGYDDAIDGQVLTANIANVWGLEVNNKNIADLTGVQGFSSLNYLNVSSNILTTLNTSHNHALGQLQCNNNQITQLQLNAEMFNLDCSYNSLTNLDLASYPAIGNVNCSNNQLQTFTIAGSSTWTELRCDHNSLQSLNVSGCTNLTLLACSFNQLTSLNQTGCNALQTFYCAFNQLTDIDVSGFSALSSFQCYVNNLNSLNITGTSALQDFYATNNPTLYCITVSDPIAADANSAWHKDASASYSTNCNATPVPPTADSNQSFCQGATIANLVASGTNLQWYAAASGGTALASSTTLASANYYVSQSINGFESERATVAVTVNANVTPTFSAVSPICSGSSLSTLPTLSTNSITGTWSPALDNTATTTYTFTPAAGQCATTSTLGITVNTTTAPIASVQNLNTGSTVANLVATGSNLKWYSAATGGSALASSTVLTSSTYYVSQTLNGCESTRTSVVVTLTSIVVPTSKISAIQCGTTLTSLSANINADYVAGYQAYRFEVTNGAIVNTVEVNKYNFSLTQTPGIAYGTTYGVRVAVKKYDTWGAYGVSCTVTTPALVVNVIPTTTLMPSICGTTLATLDTKIGATPVSAATGYRFEIVKNGVTTVYESSTYNFKLSQSGVVVAYGTTYTIRVAVQVNGVYGNYGTSCNVTTPVLTVNVIPTTTVIPSFCGTTLAALDTKIGATIVSGASGYRFEITVGGTTTVYDSAVYNFRLADAGVAAYGTTYSIRVAALVNGVYGNYGVSCNVTTPALTVNVIPTTTVISSFCGTTLAALDTKIGAAPISAATGYRFEITTGGVITVYDSTVYNFRLSDAGVAAYGTTYSIRVAALVNGVYGNFGASCNVSTPILTVNTVPTTTIQPIFCGAILATLDTKIGAVLVAGATKARFEVTIAGGSPVVYEVAAYNFKLSQTGVAVLYNTSYSIRVAALVGGVWGNYGASCTVTTPAAPIVRLKAITFEVSAYPNPFETAFRLNLETPSKEAVTIAVYDMMGKLVETHQANPTEVAYLQIGNNFAAGIYNVIVSQANEMQAIRLIRK